MATVLGRRRPRIVRNFDPLLIEENWWDRGPADTTARKVTIRNNHPVTSPSQIPASIVDNAGLEAPYQPLLDWRPAE